MLSEYIGLVLRQIRIETGKSQEDVAIALSRKLSTLVRQSYISHIETNSCNISLERLELICSILGKKVR